MLATGSGTVVVESLDDELLDAALDEDELLDEPSDDDESVVLVVLESDCDGSVMPRRLAAASAARLATPSYWLDIASLNDPASEDAVSRKSELSAARWERCACN
jgi:hypothetical protein